MATENTIAGTGLANQTIQFTFSYLDETDIKVEIRDTTKDGDEAGATTQIVKDDANGWILLNPTTIRLQGTLQPSSTDVIRIYRQTDISNKAVNFTAGSAIRAQDLNKAFDQSVFSVEEWRDQRVPLYGATMPDDINMGNNKVVNMDDADSDSDAVNRKQLGNLIANDLSDDTAQGLQINKSTGGSNSNDLATFTILDSSKTQKGSVTINEGEGIDVTYTNGNAVISGEDSSKTNKGIVSIDEGEGINVAYTAGDAVISAEDSSKTNKGVVTINEGEGINVTYTNGDAVISGEDSSKTNKGVVAIDEAHAIGVSYTNGTATISADKSNSNQQGVVRITNATNTDGNPIHITRTGGDGEIQLGILNDSIDLNKIKDNDKITESEQDQSPNTVADTNILTGAAAAKRHDVIVQNTSPDPTPPSPGGWQVGKLQYQNVAGARVLKLWDGSQWRVVSPVGESFVPTTNTIIRYVDSVNGDDTDNNQGYLPHKPLQTIEKALDLVNNDSTGDGTVIFVDSGVYKENLPLIIKKKNVSIIGRSMRSVFVLPKNDTEAYKDMFHVDSGSYIAFMTLLGLKINPATRDGARNYALDNDATYGLPTGQNWAVRFRTDVAPTILKSPYVQNCTHFSDAHLDIANFNSNTFPSTDAETYSAVAGDQTSAPSAGGLLVDGNACAATSPIRSMVVDAFTQITLDGPGILATNNGYAQLVSFFGTFAHYHAKAKNGGQLNLSNCVSDFGRYGLIADGHGDTFATATASAANSGATTVTVGALTTTSGHHVTATEPLDHMMITIDGNDYGVVSSTANGSGWDVTITPALSQNISNTSVAFSLRSYISTGGHTFEYVGVGTHYGDHPDKGGKAIEANQSIELNGGRVWLSSTDHIGKFKAGTALTVDSVSETVDLKSVTIKGTSTPASLKFNTETDAKSVTLKAPTNASLTSYELTLPTGGVAAGKVLQTDANGNLSFEYPLADGDKGDIIVASNGTSWTIDNGVVDADALAANAVVTVKIQDDAVTDAKLADHASNDANRAVGTNHIKDANVTLGKVENLTSAQIIVGNSANRPTAVTMSGDVTISNTGATTIGTGAVEHAMLAADAVDGDNIADNSINSEHYVDASIDEAHLANDAVTDAKLSHTGVSANTYNYASITVNQQGRITSASSGSTPLTSATIDGCTDTTISSSPTDGQFLEWDSGTSKWVNGTKIHTSTNDPQSSDGADGDIWIKYTA